MRSLSLLGFSVLSLAATGCFSPLPAPPVELPMGNQFTFTLASPQSSNVSVGTYETTLLRGEHLIYGTLNSSSIIAQYGTNTAANNAPCQVLGLTFMGKPEAGKQWQLLIDPETTHSTAPGTGTLTYADTCSDTSKPRAWISASGTLRIDSVTDPDPRVVPAGYPAGSLKTVTLTLMDLTMVPAKSNVNATGTFTLHAEGRVELMSGMDQP